MNWYLARIVFQIICGEGKHQPQFDEQLRLVEAANEDIAFQRAVALGQNEAEAFFNHKDQLVQWRFVNVSELYRLSLIDGAELHSKVVEVDDAVSYVEMIHAKADQIQQKNSHQLLQLL